MRVSTLIKKLQAIEDKTLDVVYFIEMGETVRHVDRVYTGYLEEKWQVPTEVAEEPVVFIGE